MLQKFLYNDKLWGMKESSTEENRVIIQFSSVLIQQYQCSQIENISER